MGSKVILAALVASMFLSGCGRHPEPKVFYGNTDVGAIQKITENFAGLSAKVDSMTAGMSAVEKERAAFFLVSAYSLVMQSYVERGDPAKPMLTDWMYPPRKFGGDNPYTIYTQAPVSGEFSYKLSGKKGNAVYMGVQMYGYSDGFNLPTANLNSGDIVYNNDGTFEIFISRERPSGGKNWIPLQEGDHAFLVRQYFGKRTGNIPAELKIETTGDSRKKGSSYLTRLEIADAMLTDYIMGTIDIASLLRETAMNEYAGKKAEVRSPKYGGALYPTKDNRYEGCWVSLKPGEALRVHGRLPKNTLYASYVFYDRWYNTPDYPKINCFRTMDEIVLNSDGSFDLYVSPETVNGPNWINTGGLYEGSYSSRYLQSTETVFPDVEVVKIADIPATLY